MKVKTQALILFSFLLLVVALVYLFRTQFTAVHGDTCVLLTTTVYINTTEYLNENNTPEARLKQYIDSINRWLKNTDLDIYIVESSNYDFPEYKNNPRVKVYTFKSENDINCKHCSATPYEAESILRAFNHFGLKVYDKIIKVTGKYYIPDMKKLINNIPPDSDLYFQNTHNYDKKIQNSEIFGCRTKYLPKIMNLIKSNSRLNMNFENTLYSLIGKYKIYRFPPIKLDVPVKRSGDNKIMDSL